MGDTNGDGEKAERPVREVRIGYNFAVGKYEVTQTMGGCDWIEPKLF